MRKKACLTIAMTVFLGNAICAFADDIESDFERFDMFDLQDLVRGKIGSMCNIKGLGYPIHGYGFESESKPVLKKIDTVCSQIEKDLDQMTTGKTPSVSVPKGYTENIERIFAGSRDINGDYILLTDGARRVMNKGVTREAIRCFKRALAVLNNVHQENKNVLKKQALRRQQVTKIYESFSRDLCALRSIDLLSDAHIQNIDNLIQDYDENRGLFSYWISAYSLESSDRCRWHVQALTKERGR